MKLAVNNDNLETILMNNLPATTNHLLKTSCRQCNSAIPAKAIFCPTCGISRPNAASLNSLEKQYLVQLPMIPPKFHSMLETADAKKSLAANIANEAGNYLSNFQQSYVLLLAMLLSFAGGTMLMTSIFFPLSFILFWTGMVYMGYDAVNFTRAATNSYLIKRLQHKTGASPYSVHFKLEAQIVQMLQSLQLVTNSFFEHDWRNRGTEPSTSIDSFLSATNTLTQRLKKFADLSFETIAIIWRHNVYSIVAQDSPLQDKVIAISNKIREAEAIILRYQWLSHIDQINGQLKDFVAGKIEQKTILDRFQLAQYGPIQEPYTGDLEHAPFEIPFKMRYFWHQQLPPFPISGTEILKDMPKTQPLFESIEQVRKLKAKLEEQMLLDCVSSAISDVSSSGAAAEADEVKRFQLYSTYLDVPAFQPSEKDLNNKIDKLRAEMRVNLNI